MSVLLLAVIGFVVLVIVSRVFYKRQRDRRFRSGYKWNEAAILLKQRMMWLAAAFILVLVMIAVHDATLK